MTRRERWFNVGRHPFPCPEVLVVSPSGQLLLCAACWATEARLSQEQKVRDAAREDFAKYFGADFRLEVGISMRDVEALHAALTLINDNLGLGGVLKSRLFDALEPNNPAPPLEYLNQYDGMKMMAPRPARQRWARAFGDCWRNVDTGRVASRSGMIKCLEKDGVASEALFMALLGDSVWLDEDQGPVAAPSSEQR